MLLELTNEVEAITAFAAFILDIGTGAFDLDGSALETGEVGTALLWLFRVEQCTTDEIGRAHV